MIACEKGKDRNEPSIMSYLNLRHTIFKFND